MSKTYTLQSTAIVGGQTTQWWSNYWTNVAVYPNHPYAGRNGRDNTVYWFTNIMFNATTLASLRSKTITSIKLTITRTGGSGESWQTNDLFPLCYKYTSDSGSNSTSTGNNWSRSNADSSAQAATVIKYLRKDNATVSGSSYTYDLTGSSVPKYGYVLGCEQNGGEYFILGATATLVVVTNETDYTLKLSYNANGGSGAPSAQSATVTTSGTPSYTFTIPTTKPTRTGYAFAGWATSSSASSAQYSAGGTITISANTTLYAVWTPQKSVITSATSAAIGSATTVKWTNYGSYTTKIRFVCGLADSGQITVTGTQYSYTLPSSWYAQIPNSTSGTATAYLYTFSGSTQIGVSTYNFTASVPASVVPSIGTLSAARVNDNSTVSGWGIYLQNYSKVKITASGCAAGTGATIQSYTITGQNLQYSTQSSLASANATSDVIEKSGTLTYTCKITDSRGRTATKTVSITVYAYSLPSITSLTANRSNSSGTADPVTGTYINARMVFSFASANGHNTLTRTISYKLHTASSYTQAASGMNSGAWTGAFGGGNIAVDRSYDVKGTVTDALGNTSTYVVIVQSVVGISFGLKNDRARFGGVCEKAGLQVDWPSDFKSTISNAAGADLSRTGTRLGITDAPTVVTGTWTDVLTLDLPAGVWVIYGFAQYSSNATGYRAVVLSRTDTTGGALGYGAIGRAAAASGTATNVNCTFMTTLTASMTVHLILYQNSGADRTVNCGIQAVRIA